MASIQRDHEMGVVSHYNVQPVVDIYGTVRSRDRGAMGRDIERITNASRKQLPRFADVRPRAARHHARFLRQPARRPRRRAVLQESTANYDALVADHRQNGGGWNAASLPRAAALK